MMPSERLARGGDTARLEAGTVRGPDDRLGPARREALPRRELKRMVSSYKLDMLEHDGYVVTRACAAADHPHAPPPHRCLPL